MKETLLSVLSTVLSVLIVGFGMVLSTIYVKYEFGVTTLIIGLIGYFLALRPAINEWEQRFKKWFKVEE
jgi:hypothetical protein